MPDSARRLPSLDVLDDRTRRLEADQSKIWDALEAIKEVRVGIGRIEEQLSEGNSKFERFERLLDLHSSRISAVEQSQAVTAATCKAIHAEDRPEKPDSHILPLKITIGATASGGVGIAIWEAFKAWFFGTGGHHP